MDTIYGMSSDEHSTTLTLDDDPSADGLAHTRVTWMYRDPDNYKEWQEIVLPGLLTNQQKEAVWAALDGGENFLPAQVGMDTLYDRFASHYDSDHVWHELVDIEDSDAEPTDTTQTAAEWASRFDGVVWDIDAAVSDFEDWGASTPRGA